MARSIIVEQPNLYERESGSALVIRVGHANNCTVQCHRDGVNHSPDSRETRGIQKLPRRAFALEARWGLGALC
jgi:hypothetical protein